MNLLIQMRHFLLVQDALVLDVYAWQLVSQGDPVGATVVRAPKQFDVPPERTHALDHAVDFVGFPGGLPHFRDDQVTVQRPHDLRVTFHAH